MAAYLLPGFPVRSPRGGGSLPAPLFALRPGLSQEDVMRTKEKTKETVTEGKTKGKTRDSSSLLLCQCHERRRGQEQW